jgi:hypothetical protein
LQFHSPLLPVAQAIGDTPPSIDENASQPQSLPELPKDSGAAWEIVSRSLYEMWTDFLARVPLIIAALVVVGITWTVARLVSYFVRASLSKTRL